MLFYEKVKPTALPPLKNEKEEAEDIQKFADLKNIPTLSGYDVFEPDVRLSNETHQWQSFLFDSEFQAFLRGMLSFCRHSSGDVANVQDSDDSWRSPVIQMLLSFFFDVMLYSSDISNQSRLGEWAMSLEELMLAESENAISFVRTLARKTGEISENWLRTFLMDCPDQGIRGAALRIFCASVKTCIRSAEEIRALSAWVRSWREQLAELESIAAVSSQTKTFVMPNKLQGKHSTIEDVTKVGNGSSCLGIIISFTNVLLENLPRCWRFSPELCIFVKNLALMRSESGEFLLKRPMVDGQVPLRLISYLAREHCPTYLRLVCPGASISADASNTQIRAESNPSPHVISMTSNQVLNASDLNNPRGPSSSDFMNLLETVAILGNLHGAIQAQLVRETEDIVRGRHWYTLTEEATKALSIIFQENCAPGAPGMGYREIESYLRRSGVDAGQAMSNQKIQDMLAKYPTAGGDENNRGGYLSVEGFIAYYRDCIQTNDIRLRMDLHTFGFRPDLTRRSRESRFFTIGERESQCLPVQSVALDVGEKLKERMLELGKYSNFGLSNTVALYHVAYEVSEPLMEYLIAGASCGSSNSEILIDRILTRLYILTNDWEGNKAATCSSVMLQAIACVPGENQNEKIARIMTSTAKPARNLEFGAGIINVLKALHRMRQTPHYSNEAHWTHQRYMLILRELHNLYPIFNWMKDNRNLWTFCEREVLDARTAGHRNQVRVEYSHRDHDESSQLEPSNTNSDSDMGGMNESEEDDDDSQFDKLDVDSPVGNGPTQVVIEGAGTAAVNGVYTRAGVFENAIQYAMEGIWNGNRYKFYIFLCSVSNNTRHWYISIVPSSNPGTNADIDFYTAPCSEKCTVAPPKDGWTKTTEGLDPPPRLLYRNEQDEEGSEIVLTSGVDVVDDDTAEEPNLYDLSATVSKNDSA
jgi:ubiquitin carboxyl-terminal hydrolase 9/24